MYQEARHEISPHMTVVHQIFLLGSNDVQMDNCTMDSRIFVRSSKTSTGFETNAKGQVISYRHSQSAVVYEVNYDAEGLVQAVESSDGWSWRKVSVGDQSCWQVRNYFDCWQVSSRDCHSVEVDENGITAKGESPAVMCFPVQEAD